MKNWEILFLIIQAAIAVSGFLTFNLWIIIGTFILLVFMNVGAKAYIAYSMTPQEIQEHKESGGSGIWC